MINGEVLRFQAIETLIDDSRKEKSHTHRISPAASSLQIMPLKSTHMRPALNRGCKLFFVPHTLGMLMILHMLLIIDYCLLFQNAQIANSDQQRQRAAGGC